MKIYAMEVTSECNLKCSYCPQPKMERIKEHMSVDQVEKILNYPFWFDIVIGHLFGEAFLHPELTKITKLAYEKGLAFGFSTNMRDFDLDYFDKLRTIGLLWMVISYHIPEAKQWYEILKQKYPEFLIIKTELEEKHNWSGQVDKNTKGNIKKKVKEVLPIEKTDCIFHKFNLITISAQGDIYACCLDAEGLSNQGPLSDIGVTEFEKMENNIWFELCHKCPMRYTEIELEQQYEQQKEYALRVFQDYKKIPKMI